MVGMTQSGSGVAGTPICVQDGGSAAAPVTRMPPFRPPPPPKGWQSRWGAMVDYPVWVFSADNDASARYGYAVAVNYATEEQARKAVLDQCLREVMPGREADCTGGRITAFSRAYFRVLITPEVGFGLDDFTQLKPLINARETFAFAPSGYTGCDDPDRVDNRCLNAIMALGRNGVHPQPPEQEAQDIVACPAGPTRAEQKIVGSDGASGTPVPLCGPDWDAMVMRLHAGRYDGFAVHPLMKAAPLVSTGHADAGSAERAALALCMRMIGNGCTTLGNAVNGFSAVAANDAGMMFLGKGPDSATARREAQRQCDASAGQIIPCQLVLERIAGVTHKQLFSPEYGWARFGAVALPGHQVGDRSYAAFSRGMTSRQDAEREALSLCERENPDGPKCRIAGGAAGVILSVWVADDGTMGGIASLKNFPAGFTDRNTRREDMMAAICGPRGTACKIALSEETDLVEPIVQSFRVKPFDQH